MDSGAIKQKIQSMFDDPYSKPTDIIGFGTDGKKIANILSGIISTKEICFFDETVKSDPDFHYLDFEGMLEKSEIMIFTIELPERCYTNLSALNEKCQVFIQQNLTKTIAAFKNNSQNKNIVVL